jgi:alpha-glucosidase (family GH31 glycosyl hydrolase)
MKWVPIVDIGISNRPKQDYPFVDEGYSQDVFQKIDGKEFIGRVWPGDTVYPDFFAEKTSAWWQSGMDHLHNTLNITFDGLWLDMNENSNFCFGTCYDN